MILSHDWKIQKKLLDAGGLGPVVYILPARGGSKFSVEREKYLQLLASGRQVVYVLPEKHSNLAGSRKPWLLEDRDILTPERYELADRFWNEYWNWRKEQKNE